MPEVEVESVEYWAGPIDGRRADMPRGLGRHEVRTEGGRVVHLYRRGPTVAGVVRFEHERVYQAGGPGPQGRRGG